MHLMGKCTFPFAQNTFITRATNWVTRPDCCGDLGGGAALAEEPADRVMRRKRGHVCEFSTAAAASGSKIR